MKLQSHRSSQAKMSNPLVLLSHPTGNQNVRHAALALMRADMLAEFWTCIRWNESGVLDRLLPEGIRREMRRRTFPLALEPFIRTFPWREWGRQIAGRLGLKRLVKAETGAFSVDEVYCSLDRRVARRLASCPEVRGVYGYDGGALESFRAAKAAGLKTIYEHPIIHWRKVRQLQEEEAELHPEWRPTLGALRDSAGKFERKDEELALADVILVATTFSKESLALAPRLSAAIHVIPYGSVPVSAAPRIRSEGKKLKVLFVGGLGQAKGLGYLLEAADRLAPHIDLTLIGPRLAPAIPDPAVLQRWQWFPSLTHDGVLQQMGLHDVLVFPSLHEGFGMVILEAMSQGLPVIASHHTAAADLITDGREGFLIPIRSSSAIVEKLEVLIRDRHLLAAMSIAAQRLAEQWSWERYQRRLAEVAKEALGP